MANRWSMNASYAYNDAVDTFELAGAREIRPAWPRTFAPGTRVPRRANYAPESGGSGIGNVFQNAKWLVKLNGRVQLP